MTIESPKSNRKLTLQGHRTLVITWQDGPNAMRDVEYGAYFKHANFVLVKIISFLNEITNLKKNARSPSCKCLKAEQINS